LNVSRRTQGSRDVMLELLPYLEPFQVRTHVGADFIPLDNVPAVLGMATHGSRAGTLVVAFVDVLGREPQLAIAHALEDTRRLHFTRFVVVNCVI